MISQRLFEKRQKTSEAADLCAKSDLVVDKTSSFQTLGHFRSLG